MLTFQQYLEEDFNSPKATQVSIPVLGFGARKTGPTTGVMCFYEAMPRRSFNLMRYMKSFDSQDAKDILNNTMGHWRGLIYEYELKNEFLVFVWRGAVLHYPVATALDKVAGKSIIPVHKYLKIYNGMSIIDPGEAVGNWCFPIISYNGQIRTNLSEIALNELEKQKGLKQLFQFDGNQFASLLKNDM